MFALLLLSLALPASAGPPEVPPIPLPGGGSTAGRVVVVNVWASWCGPCRAELPLLDGLQDRLGPEGVSVVALTVDEDRRAAEALLKRLRVDLPLVSDPTLAATLDPPALPTTYLVDRQGRIVRVHEGGLDAGEVDRLRVEAEGLLVAGDAP